MTDRNMDTARQWASELGPPLDLPPSLNDVEQRAKLAEAIGLPLIRDCHLHLLSEDEKSTRLNEVGRLSKPYIPDVEDCRDRINITLRLWSGCIDAAKTIALQTMSGPNTPQMRKENCENKLDPVAQTDPDYCAGVEAAPSFKSLLQQEYSFEGVPKTSVVRRYP